MTRRQMFLACLAAAVPAPVLARRPEPLRIVSQRQNADWDIRYEADGTLTVVHTTVTTFNRPLGNKLPVPAADRETFGELVRRGHVAVRPGWRRISAAYDLAPDGLTCVATYTDKQGFARTGNNKAASNPNIPDFTAETYPRRHCWDGTLAKPGMVTDRGAIPDTPGNWAAWRAASA